MGRQPGGGGGNKSGVIEAVAASFPAAVRGDVHAYLEQLGKPRELLDLLKLAFHSSSGAEGGGATFEVEVGSARPVSPQEQEEDRPQPQQHGVDDRGEAKHAGR